MRILVILTIGLCIGNLSCHHDSFVPDCPQVLEDKIHPCEQWPPFQNLGIIPVSPEIGFVTMVANPLNANEFAYIKLTSSQSNELWIMDLCSGEQRFVKSDPYGPPAWGSKNWIAVFDIYLGLCIVKPSGDSLTYLGSDSQPLVWHPDGEHLIVMKSGKHFSLNVNTGKVDTFSLPGTPEQTYGYSWFSDKPDHVAYAFITGLGCMNLATGERTELTGLTGYPDSYVVRMVAIPYTHKVAWIGKKEKRGLFITDFESGETQQIGVNCDNITYFYVSALADGSKLLVHRFDKELLHLGQNEEANTIYSESNIYLMDLDGSNERRIVIK